MKWAYMLCNQNVLPVGGHAPLDVRVFISIVVTGFIVFVHMAVRFSCFVMHICGGYMGH